MNMNFPKVLVSDSLYEIEAFTKSFSANYLNVQGDKENDEYPFVFPNTNA